MILICHSGPLKYSTVFFKKFSLNDPISRSNDIEAVPNTKAMLGTMRVNSDCSYANSGKVFSISSKSENPNA